MGTVREVDAISDAIIATEKEIAGSAFDQEDTDALDETGDRSLEDIGGGLEGQHEAEDDDEADGEEAEGEEKSDGEGEAETAAAAAVVAAAKPGAVEQPESRVPSGKLREANEARRAAEAERDTLKAQIEKGTGENKSLADRLDLVMREIADLKRAPRTEQRQAEQQPQPEVVPDIFEDPKGFIDHITKGFEAKLSVRDQQLAAQRVETSMAIAHSSHKETFEKAWGAINQLNPNDPDARVVVQRIYAAPNPGEALVAWHKRNQTLAEVGDDPAAYRARVAEETRAALLKDPEFRKQLIADLRGEAAAGDNGTPRTETRLPRSLARASGSNLGAERGDPQGREDSDQAVADAAWRT